MDKVSMTRLLSEQPLSVEESLRLDEALDGMEHTAHVLSQLKDDAPSLAWRSQLNDRLAKEVSQGKKRVAIKWFGSLAATSAVALAAFVMVKNLPGATPQSKSETPVVVAQHEGPSVEESLVSAHKEADMENSMGVSWVQVDYEKSSGS